MKKIHYCLALAALLLGSACGETNPNGVVPDDVAPDTSTPSDLTTLTLAVKDAKLIYKRSSSTTPQTTQANQTKDQTGYWKVNFDGETQRLEFLNADGKAAAVEIQEMIKLSDDLLFVKVTKPYYASLLVNSTTGKVYKAPDDFRVPIQKDPSGMIYYNSVNRIVRRLDPKSFAVNDYLPAGQQSDVFLISRNASCFYASTNEFFNDHLGYIKCRSGAIVPEVKYCFADAERTLYSASHEDGLQLVSKLDDSSGSAVTFGEPFNVPVGPILQNLVNPLTKKTMLFCTDGIADLDGTTVTVRKDYHRIPDSELNLLRRFTEGFVRYAEHYGFVEWGSVCFSSNKLFYTSGQSDIPSKLKFYAFDLNDYSVEEITIPGFMIYSVSASPSSHYLTVSGLEYSTGEVMVGEWDLLQGGMNIISRTDTTDKIEKLICLN